MSKELRIKGESKRVLADWLIIKDLYKVTKRKSLRENIKRFSIKINKAEGRDNMGIKFHQLKDACIVHFDIPSGRSMQLIVGKDMDLKEMKKVKGLNETYVKLIETAYYVALGKDPQKKGVIKKLKDAIF